MKSLAELAGMGYIAAQVRDIGFAGEPSPFTEDAPSGSELTARQHAGASTHEQSNAPSRAQ